MDFYFKWKTTESNGKVSGFFEQTIFAHDSATALKQFTSFHGEIGPDSYGCSLEITSIKVFN